jgi:hypothetical protein
LEKRVKDQQNKELIVYLLEADPKYHHLKMNTKNLKNPKNLKKNLKNMKNKKLKIMFQKVWK